MEVNYNASVEDVYTEFVRAMIKSSVHNYRLEATILQYACAFPDTLHKSLPSWVPDWRNTRQFRRLPFDQSFIMPPFTNPKCHGTEFRGIGELLIKGFVNGRIRSILSTDVPRLCDYPQTSTWEAEMASYLKKAWDMAFTAINAWSTFARNQDPTQTISPEENPDQTRLMEGLLLKFFITISANVLSFDTPNFTHLPSTDLEPAWGPLQKYREWDQRMSSILSQFAHATFLRSDSTVVPHQDDNPEEKGILTHRLSVIQAVMEGRSFFVTDNGNMGVTSSRCQEGDLVCSFITASTHFVVRPNTQFEYSDDLTVRLIGDAYYSFGASVDVVKGESPRQFIIV